MAQQSGSPVRGNAGQASQPGAVSPGVGNPAPANPAGSTQPGAPSPSTPTPAPTASKASPTTITDSAVDDNPYDPLLAPPPLPKGKATLIGGIATHVDQVRYRLTVKPFGGGSSLKIVLDERTHVYRNGTETTVLGIHKGDRVYVDTMLDGSRVFARNVRVENNVGIAEVRGQVTAVNGSTVTVRDELSLRPVTFTIDNGTTYSAARGSASGPGDLQPGALVDVQLSPVGKHDVARQVLTMAKPGEGYVFSGTVTHIDMRTGLVAVDNRSDDQTYDLTFNPSILSAKRDLKVGAEITARAVFDGKAYRADSLDIDQTSDKEDVQSKAQ